MISIKKNIFSIIGIFLLAAGLAVSLFFLRATFKGRTTTRQKIKELSGQIKKIEKSKQGVPTLNLVTSWKKKYAEFQNDYLQVTNIFNKPVFLMPGRVSGPLAFKEEVFTKQRAMMVKARWNGLSVPPSMGFDRLKDNIPKQEEIPDLTKQSEILERLVLIMIDSGLLKLENITFLPPAEKSVDGVDSGPVYRRFGVELTLEGYTENLIKFLHRLEVDDFMFVVEKLKIRQKQSTGTSEDGVTETQYLVLADLQVSAYVFLFDFDKGGAGET